MSHTFQVWFLPTAIVAVTVLLSFPMGRYLAWIMDGQYRPRGLFASIERLLNTGPQNWKQFTIALLLFNTVMFIFGYIVLALQPKMPLNPDDMKMLAPSTIFNTTTSFLTNTNLQHYS